MANRPDVSRRPGQSRKCNRRSRHRPLAAQLRGRPHGPRWWPASHRVPLRLWRSRGYAHGDQYERRAARERRAPVALLKGFAPTSTGAIVASVGNRSTPQIGKQKNWLSSTFVLEDWTPVIRKKQSTRVLFHLSAD